MRCPECGFDWDAGERGALVGEIAAAARLFGECLAGRDAEDVRRRPAPGVWSALEYAAHTRDALAFYERRVERMVGEDSPRLDGFDPDAAAEHGRYAAEEVSGALASLAVVADRFAARLRALTPEQWSRPGIGLDGGRRDVEAMARRAAHEVRHHLADAGMPAGD